jgi:hypothetical protein
MRKKFALYVFARNAGDKVPPVAGLRFACNDGKKGVIARSISDEAI